jgi:hypothetical protein
MRVHQPTEHLRLQATHQGLQARLADLVFRTPHIRYCMKAFYGSALAASSAHDFQVVTRVPQERGLLGLPVSPA